MVPNKSAHTMLLLLLTIHTETIQSLLLTAPIDPTYIMNSERSLI